MKILLVTGTFRPSINGVAVSVDVLSRNLINLGHKVLVLAPQNNEANKDGKEILRYPSIPNPFMKDYPIPLLPLTPAIYEKVKLFKPDVVHVQHPFHIGFFANHISEQLKIPLVFTYHTRLDYYTKKYFKLLSNEVRGGFVENNVLDFCKKCDLIIAPSKDVGLFLNKKGITNTIIVPTIVDDLQKPKLSKDTLRKKMNLPVNKKILLFVGRLALEKNVNLIVKSMINIPEDFVLVMCGAGALEKSIKKNIVSLGLQRRVLLQGKIERERLGDYYAAADYFYYPSKSETQGIIYWEALSFGLPIVCVDSEAAREWVDESFGIISKNSPTEMANNVVEINKKNYKLLSRNAQNYSKKFTSKKWATTMVQEYSKLIEGNKLTQKLLSTGWQSWSLANEEKSVLFYERNFMPQKKEFINYPLETNIKIKSPVSGWCSWYAYGRNINEYKILKQISWFKENKDIPIEYILIDEGYCKWGDWNKIDSIRFPNGFKNIQKAIGDSKMKFGLWIAPFLVEKDSDLYKNHPDLTTTMKNKPVLGIKGSIFDKYVFERYILDIRKKKVRKFIFKTIDSLLKNGDIKLIKLDFLFCAYFIPGITSVEAGRFIREIFMYIREKYPKVYTIACGAPLTPLVGAVDSMRIGPDTISPVIEKVPFIFKIFNISRVKEVFNSIDNRLWTNKYWNLDPDVMVCRKNLGFDDKTLSKLLIYIKKCKGNIFLGDDMTKLSKERIQKYIKPLFKS